MNIGILALQGDFAAHANAIGRIGGRAVEVRKASQLPGLDGLVLPGGESSTMLRLIESDLLAALKAQIEGGLPTLATCAGLILLAKKVTNPAQSSLGLLDIDIRRNGYGRQLDSFVEPAIECTPAGAAALRGAAAVNGAGLAVEAVFIRAPIITRAGSNVLVLASKDEHPLLVQQESILGATFHPELSSNTSPVYRLFGQLVQEDRARSGRPTAF